MNPIKSKSGLLLATLASAVVSTSVSAAPITVDGVLSAGEYLEGTAGTDHGTLSLQWYNDHHSENGLSAGRTNDLHWQITEDAGSTMLNVFFEVPGSARRMIWDDGCNYENGDTIAHAGCGDLSTALQSQGMDESDVYDVLTAYEDNHHGHINMSHKTQIESELFELQTVDQDTLFMTHWDDSSQNLGSNYSDHATSYDWVLANGCDTSFCDAWDTTASIEVQWEFGNLSEAGAFLNSVGLMRLHLSDEARGLDPLTNIPNPPPPAPPVSVSEPGSLGLILLGLSALGWSRRRTA